MSTMKPQEIFHILFLLFHFQYETMAFTCTIAQSRNCGICTWNKLPDQYNGFRYDCSCCGFMEVPRFKKDAKKIHLSYNNISIIRSTSFLGMTSLREIYFDNNQLTVIEKNSFDGLKEHLRILVLAVNKLTTPSLESFRFLTNLWHLDIARNNYDDYPNAFTNLISLQFLKIDAIRYRFDNKIENMKKLEVLELTPSNSDMQLTLENDTFVGLGNLEIKTLSLDLRTDVKGPIGIDVLKPFRFIKNLFISINGGHDIRDILKMLHGIRHRSLDYMNLAYDKMEGDRSLDLRANDVQYLLNICVKSIDLTRNNIYHFPFLESLNTNFSNCLEKLVYAGNNGLSDSEVLGIASFPVLKYIDLSISPSLMRNTIIIGKRFTQKSPFHLNITSNAFQNLQYLDISYRDLSKTFTHIFDGSDESSIVIFFFNFPKLEILKSANTYFNLCSRNTYSSRSLVTLDMSGWNCQSLHPSFLRRHTDLMYLNASNSKIGDHVNDEKINIFSSLSKLQNVDLSRNNIYRFKSDFFDDQADSLQYLNISLNRIKNVPEMLMHLTNLSAVSLQSNEFISFDVMDRYIIDTLANTTFDFKGNVFECTCQYIDSLVWLNRTRNIRNNLICKDGTKVSIILQDIHNFWLRCISEFWLDFSIIALLLLTVTLLVVTIAYRKKSYVMYLYIKVRRHIRQTEAEIRRNDYKYDVFVSYSHLDYDWVTGQLFHYLSNELSLEVCLHQKDFIPGEPIASEILRCVESSRKTVFVITRNFLASKWSMMEMDIARHHVFNDDNDTIIVILKEDIPLHEMPLSLRKIWWRIVCLKYPQNSSRFEQEVFEKRLSDAFLLKT